jgi:F-type H+-transporting ATPase subunit b
MRCTTLALILLGCLAAAPARAEAGPLFAATEGEESGQMDIFKGALDLTIWTIVVFLGLFFLLSRFAWPQIREGLDKREKSIAHDKQEAIRAKQEADALRVKLDQELAHANDQVRQIMDKARQDADALAAVEIARGKAELQGEKERLQTDLRRQQQQVFHEAMSQAVGLATLISAKAVKKALSEEEHRALLDEALAEFQGAARDRVEDLGSARA